MVYLLFCLLIISSAFAQINVDFNLTKSMKWTNEGTEVTIQAKAAYALAYTDSIDVLLDTSPDLGLIDENAYPTIVIDCPSGYTAPGYEMNTVIHQDFGLAGHAPDSCLVVASLTFLVPKSLRPVASFDFGITWFGWANNPPIEAFDSRVCFDTGYSIVPPTTVKQPSFPAGR